MNPIMVVVTFVTMAATAVMAFIGGDDYMTLSLGLMPSLLCSLAILYKRDNDLISPLYMLLYMLFLGVFCKALYLLFFDYDGDAQLIVLAGLDHGVLWDGGVLLLIATVTGLCGYLMVRTPARSPVNSKPIASLAATRVFAIAAFVIGSVVLYLFIKELGIDEAIAEGALSAKRVDEDTVGNAARGAAFGYMRMGAQTLPQVAFFLHATNMIAQKNQASLFDWLALVAVAFLSLILPFLTSSRTEMIYLGIILLSIWHYSVKRISVLKGAAAVVVALVFLTLMGQLRTMSSAANAEDKEFSVSVESILKATVGRAYFMDIGKTSVIVNAVPDRVDYLYGESLVLFIVGPIPRSIWLEKPAVRIGLFVGQEIYGRDNASGVPPGYVGELYMNFGYPAVVIGMLLYGWVAAQAYNMLILKERTPLKVVIFCVINMLMAFSLLTGDVTGMMSQLFRYGVPLLLFMLLFRRGHLRKNARPVFHPQRREMQSGIRPSGYHR